MKPIPTAMLIVWTTTLAATAACDVRGDRRLDAGSTSASAPVDLYRVLCDGKRYCDDFDRGSNPVTYFGGSINLADCLTNGGAALFGSWSLDDADSHRFEWEGDVRLGGLFPTLGHVAAVVGCADEHPPMHSPDVGVALDPDGFAGARLEGDDVFIPLRGQATLDGRFRATASLDNPGVPSSPRVTVTVEGPGAPRTLHGGLGLGETFLWGGARARVVRVVAPQEGLLGAIGWVEISLSESAAPARTP